MEPTESFFRDIVECSPYPIYMVTGHNMIVSVANSATLKAWGKDASVIGKPFAEALPELHDQPFLNLIKKVFSTGEPYHTSNDRADFIINGQVETFYFKFTYQPMRDAYGQIYGVVCFATDVTELERAKQAVDESQMVLYNLIKQVPVGICIVGVNDLMIQVVNDAYLELAGKERRVLENHTIWDAIPEVADSYAPIMNNVIITGEPFFAKEHELLLIRNGKPEFVFVDFVIEPVRHFDGSINAIMVIAIEVTDKVLSRRNIEDAEERGRLAVEAAEIGTFDLNMISQITVTSSRFDAIFGHSEPVPWNNLIDSIHPEDRDMRTQAHAEALITGKLFYEARIIHPDESVHWIRTQAKIYYDTDNTPVRMLGTVLDITEFKRLQQQKDDFVSVASHELKTPMTSLKASMQILDKLIKTNSNADKVPVFIQKANSSLNKMQHLIESLLNVSKIAAGQLSLNRRVFKVAHIINECCENILMVGGQELILTGDVNVEVYADREKIEQVIVNLVNNAVKYAPDTDSIVINLISNGKMVEIAVQDFGDGIPSEKIPHLFERYYRVDSSGLQYSGLGLGLYISAEIVERHGGQIGVKSEAGRGSTFWFTLPAMV